MSLQMPIATVLTLDAKNSHLVLRSHETEHWQFGLALNSTEAAGPTTYAVVFGLRLSEANKLLSSFIKDLEKDVPKFLLLPICLMDLCVDDLARNIEIQSKFLDQLRKTTNFHCFQKANRFGSEELRRDFDETTKKLIKAIDSCTHIMTSCYFQKESFGALKAFKKHHRNSKQII